MLLYLLFTPIFASLVWYVISFVTNNRKRPTRSNATRWKISTHVGVLSTSSKSFEKKTEKENPYSSNSNDSNAINSSLVDMYATPWNNVPLGVKAENVYEPNTGELFRRLDSDFKRVAPSSSRDTLSSRRLNARDS